ncbi:MAG: hypothetical protein JWR26_2565 [Pedosphaera sp.]|nr:hypothetical protein [Pedosphaera sp.]
MKPSNEGVIDYVAFKEFVDSQVSDLKEVVDGMRLIQNLSFESEVKCQARFAESRVQLVAERLENLALHAQAQLERTSRRDGIQSTEAGEAAGAGYG